MARIATGNTEEALDIVQDAMMRLVKKYADRPADEWGPLFYKIVQSLIRDWYRRQKIRNHFRVFWPFSQQDEKQTLEENIDVQAILPEQAVGNQVAVEQIEDSLKKLPVRQQQAFILRAVEGLDTRATAEAMDCSPSSVKTHYARALKILRTDLQPHYRGDEK